MTNAEIVAYLLGAEVAQEAWDDYRTGNEQALVGEVPLTEQQSAARLRLGDEAFAYWCARGAFDTSARLAGE